MSHGPDLLEEEENGSRPCGTAAGIAAYGLLAPAPVDDNLVLLFLVDAIAASAFEYAAARLQIHLFGDFWWDYTDKPLNYKGILCLESTVGWGVAVVLLVKLLHRPLAGLVSAIPDVLEVPLAGLLLAAYIIDFSLSARTAYQRKQQVQRQGQAGEYPLEH